MSGSRAFGASWLVLCVAGAKIFIDHGATLYIHTYRKERRGGNVRPPHTKKVMQGWKGANNCTQKRVMWKQNTHKS